MIYKIGKYYINKEITFGYDVKDGKMIVNPTEAEILKYLFEKTNEYTSEPPTELVEEVIQSQDAIGITLSYEEAKTQISLANILSIIEKEIVEKWKNYFEEHNAKCLKNGDVCYSGKILKEKPEMFKKSIIEPLIDLKMYEKFQQKLTEEQNDETGFGMRL